MIILQVVIQKIPENLQEFELIAAKERQAEYILSLIHIYRLQLGQRALPRLPAGHALNRGKKNRPVQTRKSARALYCQKPRRVCAAHGAKKVKIFFSGGK